MSLLAYHTDNPTFRNASYILMGLALLIVLHYHLLPLLLSVILTCGADKVKNKKQVRPSENHVQTA
jgi:hypothetical protein